ncbi:TetR/AcrR family transcriptional regulator, partial [Nocardia sp. NPDC004722]
LIEKATDTGQFQPDADIEALLSLLLLALPHLALAPHVEGLDPVLGMSGSAPDQAVTAAQRLVAAFLSPYRTRG